LNSKNMESGNIFTSEWFIPIITLVQIIIAGIVAFATASYKFGKLEQRIDHLEEDNKDEKKELRELGKSVAEIKGQLSVNNPAAYVQRKSPVTMNERGEKLLKDSGGDDFISSNKNELFEKIKTIGYKTAYDVQENTKIVINSYKNDERFIKLKDYAFKEGVDLEIITLVLAIRLRDLFLQEIGLTPEDVDRSDPTIV